ncbi:MAG: RNA-directed DNA polymerase [Culicoidibacterales bacterium]
MNQQTIHDNNLQFRLEANGDVVTQKTVRLNRSRRTVPNWSIDEVNTLMLLCGGKSSLNWKEIYSSFNEIHGTSRTNSAINAKWNSIKKIKISQNQIGISQQIDSNISSNEKIIEKEVVEQVIDEGRINISNLIADIANIDNEYSNVIFSPMKDSDIRNISKEIPINLGIFEEYKDQNNLKSICKNKDLEISIEVNDDIIDPIIIDYENNSNIAINTIVIDKNDINVINNNDVKNGTFNDFSDCFHHHVINAEKNSERSILKKMENVSIKHLEWANLLIENEYRNIRKNQSKIGKLNACVYAAGKTIYEFSKKRNHNYFSVNAWIKKQNIKILNLEEKIEWLKKELNRRKNRQKANDDDYQIILKIKQNFKEKIRSSFTINRAIDELENRQKILKERLIVVQNEKSRKRIRNLFKNNPSMKSLQSKNRDQYKIDINIDDIYKFWKNILENRKMITDDKVDPIFIKWSDLMMKKYKENNLPSIIEIKEMIKLSFQKMKSWKAPGPDGIQMFWWKNIKSASNILTQLVIDFLGIGNPPNSWFCTGRTILIPKNNDTKDPKNFRPITCLNTCYKLFTSVINKMINSHIETYDAIPENQRALVKNEWGCTHALLKDRAIIMDAFNQKKQPLCMTWLDFSKAYDSISHKHLLWVLEKININAKILKILKRLMSKWNTKLELRKNRRLTKSKKIKLKNGIFQGDSLSPTLFCLSIAPLSYAINNSIHTVKSASGWSAGYGFKIEHQFYMDDLKLYSRTIEDQAKQINTVIHCSKTIGLELNFKKCAQFIYLPHGGDDKHTLNEQIPIISEPITYKYLGVEERLLPTTETLEKIEENIYDLCKTIFSSDLTWSQKKQAYNNIIIKKIGYIYINTLGGKAKLIQAIFHASEMDKKIRKILKDCKCRFKTSCVVRLYLPSKIGGYGLIALEDFIAECLLANWCYLTTKKNMLGEYHLFERLTNRKKRTPISDGDYFLKKNEITYIINTDERNVTINNTTFNQPTILHRYICNIIRMNNNEARLKIWKTLSSGQLTRQENNIDLELSSLWQQKGHINSTSMRNVIAVQENNIITNASVIHKGTNKNKECRKCKIEIETIHHITSHCNHWLKTLYIDRHNSVARAIYYLLADKHNLQIIHYSHAIPHSQENDEAKLLWDTAIQTLTPMKHNKPDIVLFDKIKKNILIIEVSVAAMIGIEQQRQIKTNRYTVNSTEVKNETKTPYENGFNLISDMQKNYKQKVTFVPAIVGTCGEYIKQTYIDLKKGLNLNEKQTKNLMERMARAATINTSRIIQNHLAQQ